MLPCCIARCRVRARSGAPLVVCAVATGHQLWTWPPLGTGAALSCPVVSAAWVVWGSWWHEKRRIGASPARAALIRERAAQSADHLAEKRQKWAVVGEVVCDLGKSRNTANTTTYNRTTGELRATLLGNHANAALRTALRTDRPKNGPSTV